MCRSGPTASKLRLYEHKKTNELFTIPDPGPAPGRAAPGAGRGQRTARHRAPKKPEPSRPASPRRPRPSRTTGRDLRGAPGRHRVPFGDSPMAQSGGFVLAGPAGPDKNRPPEARVFHGGPVPSTVDGATVRVDLRGAGPGSVHLWRPALSCFSSPQPGDDRFTPATVYGSPAGHPVRRGGRTAHPAGAEHRVPPGCAAPASSS
jgi:translation initiation factor IF-2